ncbi:MAG: hypothetical protein IIZ53_00875 [Ruminococcus sp.]|nr:hypothetical protein [Ruminococcus sp.]
MDIIRKTAALITAAAMMTAAGCSSTVKKTEGSSSSASNIVGNGPSDSLVMDEDNMPYGATMTSLQTQHNDKVKVDIDFDPRYFVQDGTDYPEIYLLTEYVNAMQNRDSAAMEKLFYKPYLEYSVKEKNYESVQEYLDQYIGNLENKSRSQIEFTYAVVDTCLNENEDEILTNFNFVDSKIDELSGEKLSDKVKSRKLVYMDLSFKDGQDKTYMLNDTLGYDMSVYVYNIDGTYYLL